MQLMFLCFLLITLLLVKVFACGQYNLWIFGETSLWSLIQTIPRIELRLMNSNLESEKISGLATFEHLSRDNVKVVDQEFNESIEFWLNIMRCTWLVVLYDFFLIIFLKLVQIFMFPPNKKLGIRERFLQMHDKFEKLLQLIREIKKTQEKSDENK